MRTCGYCGQPQEDSYSFCYNCGAKLSEEVVNAPVVEVSEETNIVQEEPTKTKKKTNKLVPIIIIILFVVILVGFILKPLM